MHLLCTNGSPAVQQLAHLPPMPLVIDYQYVTTTVGAPETWGIIHALQMRDRVRRVVLHMPTSSLEDLLVLMDEPFPILEQLTISSTTEGMSPILPETFLAPNLRHLTLSGIPLPRELTLLSIVSVVTLTLTNIQATSYFLPKDLVTHLRYFSRLEGLTIGFSVPLPRPNSESELLDVLETPVTLPALRRFMFNGVAAYLDSLVAQIRAPLLENLSIALFNQIAFALPHLSDLTNATLALKLPMAKVIFKHDGVSVISKHSTQEVGDRHAGFIIRVICGPFDWQIDSAEQICRSLMPVLSCVKELTLDFDGKEISTEWQNGAVDGAAWHGLLRPFIGVNTLRVCRALAWELSCALQTDDVGLDPGLLPSLQELIPDISERYTYDSFASFIDACQVAGRPVRLVLPPKLPPSPSPSQFLSGLISRYISSLPEPGPSPLCQLPTEVLERIALEMCLSSSGPPQTIHETQMRFAQPLTQPVPLEHRDNRPPPYVPVPVEHSHLPRSSRTIHSVRIQHPPPKHIQSRLRPPPKHIRSRLRPSHTGAGSTPWR